MEKLANKEVENRLNTLKGTTFTSEIEATTALSNFKDFAAACGYRGKFDNLFSMQLNTNCYRILSTPY